ncbi:MAG: hypothetical protein SGPRY_006572 [Prymnesium sp.]
MHNTLSLASLPHRWRFVSRGLLRSLAAVETDASGALRLPATVHRPCVPEPPLQPSIGQMDADKASAEGDLVLNISKV